jgi:nitrite reductase/ring-hydroxylating ferredoxin subunit
MMAETFVCELSAFEEGQRRIIRVGTEEIGVFKHEGEYYAYSNYCLHQGGPACEGLIIAKVEERIMADKTSDGLYFSDTKINFVCPWHGYEYDMKTGEFVGNRKLRLRKYAVVRRDGGLYVVVD